MAWQVRVRNRATGEVPEHPTGGPQVTKRFDERIRAVEVAEYIERFVVSTMKAGGVRYAVESDGPDRRAIRMGDERNPWFVICVEEVG